MIVQEFPSYPKIETLFDRDPSTHKVIVGRLRRPEFDAVRTWELTEKVDGTNIRIGWYPDTRTIRIGGRTDRAQIPAFLLDYLQAVFTPEVLVAAFPECDAPVVLFGEGYGPGIQKGGVYRTKEQGVAFRLFDVMVGTSPGIWLERPNIEDVANKVGVAPVPLLGHFDLGDALVMARGCASRVAFGDSKQPHSAEGLIAKSHPLLLTRLRKRLMWKLKAKDFPA